MNKKKQIKEKRRRYDGQMCSPPVSVPVENVDFNCPAWRWDEVEEEDDEKDEEKREATFFLDE